MTPVWPGAWGEPPGSALIRASAGDFRVTEVPGFPLSGDGEHVVLSLEKRGLNTLDVAARLSRLAGVPLRDIGYSGLKDRHAVTRQWFSVGLAGRGEPDWQRLEDGGDLRLLEHGRHRKKLRRGSHRGNRFQLCLRELSGERAALEQRLQLLRQEGVPNYFGPQRFGRKGATLVQAQSWARRGQRVSRARRSLYLSALRSLLFNHLLAQRVRAGEWQRVRSGEVCMLQGSRSFFVCERVDDELAVRLRDGDVHPGLPLWGRARESELSLVSCLRPELEVHAPICDFLERMGLDLSWRPTRLLADDFCWQFCDDGSLQLDFTLDAGSYATALLAELVCYREGEAEEEHGEFGERKKNRDNGDNGDSGDNSEQG